MWVLIYMSILVIAVFAILWVIEHWSEIVMPSFAHPWHNLILKIVGNFTVLLVTVALLKTCVF